MHADREKGKVTPGQGHNGMNQRARVSACGSENHSAKKNYSKKEGGSLGRRSTNHTKKRGKGRDNLKWRRREESCYAHNEHPQSGKKLEELRNRELTGGAYNRKRRSRKIKQQGRKRGTKEDRTSLCSASSPKRTRSPTNVTTSQGDIHRGNKICLTTYFHEGNGQG